MAQPSDQNNIRKLSAWRLIRESYASLFQNFGRFLTYAVPIACLTYVVELFLEQTEFGRKFYAAIPSWHSEVSEFLFGGEFGNLLFSYRIGLETLGWPLLGTRTNDSFDWLLIFAETCLAVLWIFAVQGQDRASLARWAGFVSRGVSAFFVIYAFEFVAGFIFVLATWPIDGWFGPPQQLDSSALFGVGAMFIFSIFSISIIALLFYRIPLMAPAVIAGERKLGLGSLGAISTANTARLLIGLVLAGIPFLVVNWLIAEWIGRPFDLWWPVYDNELVNAAFRFGQMGLNLAYFAIFYGMYAVAYGELRNTPNSTGINYQTETNYRDTGNPVQ